MPPMPWRQPLRAGFSTENMGESAGQPSALKQELRRKFSARRHHLLSAAQDGVEHQLRLLLSQRLRCQGGIGIYWPLKGEIDLRAAALNAVGDQGLLALPAVEGGNLHYRTWKPGSSLSKDDCGIPAPPATAGNLAADQMQLLLVPALAVDFTGVRLGYGGGWYDRLRAITFWQRIPALGVLPAGCVVSQLPREPWDIPLSGWISERGTVWIP